MGTVHEIGTPKVSVLTVEGFTVEKDKYRGSNSKFLDGVQIIHIQTKKMDKFTSCSCFGIRRFRHLESLNKQQDHSHVLLEHRARFSCARTSRTRTRMLRKYI